MADRPPLSSLTADQLRERAEESRRMAETARTTQIRDALVRLAEGLEALAVTRDALKSC
jgi:hypothetical protein